MAQFALEVFEGLIVLPELSVELFLSVGSLFCRKFGVDVLVGSRDIELDGPLLQNLLIDHLTENRETQDIGLLRGLNLVTGSVAVFKRPVFSF